MFAHARGSSPASMSALPWIGAALGVGVLYYLYKNKQPTPPPPSLGDDACALACKASGPYCIDGGASCRATNKILDALNPFTDNEGSIEGERDRREKVNDALNVAPFFGAVAKVGNTLAGAQVNKGDRPTLMGKTLRYPNGCEPFAYAPGWGKCKTGTLDMYKSAVIQGAGVDPSLYFGGEEMNAAGLSFPGPKPANGQTWEHVNKDAFLTGANGDATTFGDSTGGWFVRGVFIKPGPVGQAPRAVVMQAYNEDQFIAGLTDAQARELVDIFADPRVVSTSYTAPCGTPPPENFTWDPNPTGHWRRTTPGEIARPMPCATTYEANRNATVAHTIVI